MFNSLAWKLWYISQPIFLKLAKKFHFDMEDRIELIFGGFPQGFIYTQKK